jgi:hypothetical protein
MARTRRKLVDKRVLLGWRRMMLPIPGPVWRSRVTGHTDLDFMTEPHHRVRNFTVMALPRESKPLSPAFIARSLNLPVEQVVPILADLEAHMTFLYRNRDGAVSWAYPVTVERTPHRLCFSTGEQIYAA